MKTMAMESDEDLVVVIMTFPQRIVETFPRESLTVPREHVHHHLPDFTNDDEWEEGE